MNILNQTIKEIKNKKEKKKEKSKCFMCGSSNIIDNTFMNGSRLAGQKKCKECGLLIMF